MDVPAKTTPIVKFEWRCPSCHTEHSQEVSMAYLTVFVDRSIWDDVSDDYVLEVRAQCKQCLKHHDVKLAVV